MKSLTSFDWTEEAVGSGKFHNTTNTCKKNILRIN